MSMKKRLTSIACALFLGAVALGCGGSQKPDPAKPGDPPAAAPTDPSQATPPAANPCRPR
jgi:hypothetical protein